MARHGALNTFGRSGNPIIRSPAFKNTAGTKNESETAWITIPGYAASKNIEICATKAPSPSA